MGCNKQYKISITQNVFLIGQWGLFDKVICMPIDKMEVTDTDTGTARTYLQPQYGNGVFGNVYLSANR